MVCQELVCFLVSQIDVSVAVPFSRVVVVAPHPRPDPAAPRRELANERSGKRVLFLMLLLTSSFYYANFFLSFFLSGRSLLFLPDRKQR